MVSPCHRGIPRRSPSGCGCSTAIPTCVGGWGRRRGKQPSDTTGSAMATASPAFCAAYWKRAAEAAVWLDSVQVQLWSYNYAPEPTGIGPVSTVLAESLRDLGNRVDVVA